MNNFITSEDFIFNTKVYQMISTQSKNSNLILNQSTNLMRNLENILSFYKDNSDIDKINKNAGKNFVQVSHTTFDIVEKSKYYSKLTDGLFDITIAPLVKMWGVNSDTPHVLTNDKIREILSLVNYKDIILDKTKQEIMLAKENQQIDLGGIAKGYIADLIIDFYKRNNIESALVNIGGNIKVLGKKSSSDLWKVGIYKPEKHSSEILCSLNLENMSVVTSGTYERAFLKNNKLYHHILNPRTGYPAKTDIASITIVNESSLLCDGLSTPLLIMGSYNASQFMKQHNIEGVIITNDDKIIVSKNLLTKFSLHCDYEVLCF